MAATDPMSLVDPQYMVNLKGKWHPTYPGVLAAAMKAGLTSLEVEVIQFPLPENGNLAVCQATATFRGEDGRDLIFTEIGDCDDVNANRMIVPHKLRMAATRSKGRALRDSLGIGVALVEEMASAEETTTGAGETGVGVREQGGTRRPNERVRPAESRGDRAANPASPTSAAPGEVASMSHWCEDCGQQIQGTETKKGSVSAAVIAKVSVERWGRLLCHTCGRKLVEVESANIPAGQIAA